MSYGLNLGMFKDVKWFDILRGKSFKKLILYEN